MRNVRAYTGEEMGAREHVGGQWRRTVAGRGLREAQLRQLEAVLRELAENPRAPTSVREPSQAGGTHVADSLVGLDVEEVRGAGQIADLGSGAGFPGVPLAVALPDANVALVESQRRKCAYLETVRAHAALANVEVVCARAEEWVGGLGRNDAVVARALAPQSVVVEYAAPLLRDGGVLADWRGRRDAQDERAARRAAEQLGLRLREVRRVDPFAGARDRHLHVFVKVGETPSRFPRRAGVARKRPLGLADPPSDRDRR
jgi:16S rRNA (guanine527-N7)-methyltransferase